MAFEYFKSFVYSPSQDGGGEEVNMFYGAGSEIFERAKVLRNTMTAAEEILWKQIHINEWKLKFRRQHPIANYVVDFYCHVLKLVIELDGTIHDLDEVKRNDVYRQQHLCELGLNVLRFSNDDIYKNKKAVIETIKQTINRLNNPPSGDGGKQKLYIIKIGGNIIDDDVKLQMFLSSFVAVEGNKILVHGGGKLATKLAAQLGIEQQLIEGRRITDVETLKVVTMVYAGYINKNIVTQLQSRGSNAMGLCGADGNVIQSHKRKHATIDYGFVGDVDVVNTSFLQSLLEQNISIVLAPITHNKDGLLLNTNADTIAQEVAQAMSSLYEVHLIYSFEKAGVLFDVEDETSIIQKLTWNYYQELKSDAKIFAGMIPKLDNAFAALDKGVRRVVIGKAEELQELIHQKSGTSIVHE